MKIHCKTKSDTGDTEGHFIITKKWIQQENIRILSIYKRNTKYEAKANKTEGRNR